MITAVILEERQKTDEMAMEAVLIQELRFVLKEANYFKNRKRGSIFIDFDDHGTYKGSGFTCKD